MASPSRVLAGLRGREQQTTPAAIVPRGREGGLSLDGDAPMARLSPWAERTHGQASHCAFSHPDCTVGSGISPDHAAARDVFPAPPLAGSHRRSGLDLRRNLLLPASADLTQPRRLIHLPIDSIAEWQGGQPRHPGSDVAAPHSVARRSLQRCRPAAARWASPFVNPS